jgi:hypothetical protein
VKGECLTPFTSVNNLMRNVLCSVRDMNNKIFHSSAFDRKNTSEFTSAIAVAMQRDTGLIVHISPK